MSIQVQGKAAIVTGAGSGINLEFATLLLSKGCNVLIADLALRPDAEEVVRQYSINSAEARAVFHKTDVRDWAQLDSMFDVAIQEFGGADIVCPGAGVYEPLFSNFWVDVGVEPSTDDASESRYSTLDINLTHPIRVTQLAIAHFLKQKKPGVVVHVSSVAGQVPYFPTPLYVAAKHALNGFVRSLGRLEFPPAHLSHIPKIRVNAVAPARILTPLWTENPDKLRMLGDNPGWILPDVVAKVMLDLVINEEYVGGTIVEVGDRVRIVQTYNDPGPKGSGNGVQHDEREEEDMWQSMQRQYEAGVKCGNGTERVNGAVNGSHRAAT